MVDVSVLAEVELGDFDWADDRFTEKLADAIDRASDQDQASWLTDDGKRIAAIVPVDVLEQHLNWLREVMTGEQWRDKPPFVVGYDDAMNGRPQSVRWGDKLDVARYQTGYGIGTLDRQREAERRS
jgi:hypothetical protein